VPEQYESAEDSIGKISLGGKRRDITLGLLARVYNSCVSKVLAEKLTEMKQYMDKHSINYDACTEKAPFKIATVGGFCNFFLVRKQVEVFFDCGTTVDTDLRFRDIIRERSACERAISYGTALIANGVIDFQQTAPCSLGVRPLDRETGKPANYYCWSVKKDEVIQPNRPYFLRSDGKKSYGVYRVMGKIDTIACNYEDDDSGAVSGPISAKNLEKLDEMHGHYKIAFSFDEDMILSIHIIEVTDQSGKQEVRAQTFVLDQLEKLTDGFIHEVGGI